MFLDEIGNIPVDLQIKLLSVLQTKTVRKIGSNISVEIDVRVICATNAPIYDLVKNGTFRQDLFYRIKTIEIQLPPLRERKEDIPELFHYYFDHYVKRYNKSIEPDPTLIDSLTNTNGPEISANFNMLLSAR